MSEFKKRLKEVGGNILTYGIAIVVILLLIWAASFIPQIVLAWILGIIIGLMFLGALIGLGMHVWDFIKWLFIEPFRKEKR